MTIAQAYAVIHNHMGEIAIAGAVLAQIVTALPDSKFRTVAGNVLHGLFPSLDVAKTGVAPTSARAPAIPPPPPVPANDTAVKP